MITTSVVALPTSIPAITVTSLASPDGAAR
jgi:hypothetical protein